MSVRLFSDAVVRAMRQRVTRESESDVFLQNWEKAFNVDLRLGESELDWSNKTHREIAFYTIFVKEADSFSLVYDVEVVADGFVRTLLNNHFGADRKRFWAKAPDVSYNLWVIGGLHKEGGRKKAVQELLIGNALSTVLTEEVLSSFEEEGLGLTDLVRVVSLEVYVDSLVLERIVPELIEFPAI